MLLIANTDSVILDSLALHGSGVEHGDHGEGGGSGGLHHRGTLVNNGFTPFLSGALAPLGSQNGLLSITRAVSVCPRLDVHSSGVAEELSGGHSSINARIECWIDLFLGQFSRLLSSSAVRSTVALGSDWGHAVLGVDGGAESEEAESRVFHLIN